MPQTVRTIAEAVAFMMVEVKAREFQLQQFVEEFKELNETIKNAIVTDIFMANVPATRDTYTSGHTARAAELSHAIAL